MVHLVFSKLHLKYLVHTALVINFVITAFDCATSQQQCFFMQYGYDAHCTPFAM